MKSDKNKNKMTCFFMNNIIETKITDFLEEEFF